MFFERKVGCSGLHDLKDSVNQEKEREGFVTRQLPSTFESSRYNILKKSHGHSFTVDVASRRRKANGFPLVMTLSTSARESHATASEVHFLTFQDKDLTPQHSQYMRSVSQNLLKRLGSTCSRRLRSTTSRMTDPNLASADDFEEHVSSTAVSGQQTTERFPRSSQPNACKSIL